VNKTLVSTSRRTSPASTVRSKRKFLPVDAMRAHWRRRIIAAVFISLGIRRRRPVNLSSQLLNPTENSGSLRKGERLNHVDDLDVLEKRNIYCLCWYSKPVSTHPSSVTMPLLQGSSSSSASSSSSYICHGVWPVVDPFRSHVSRSLFKGLS
jgi:hypothetical protein